MSDALRAIVRTIRSLARSPGASGSALLTLSLGIAALALAYRAAHPVLIRPIDLPEPERLVDVRELVEGSERSVAPANYLDWRQGSSSFRDLAAYDGSAATLVLADGGVRVSLATVSGNFFRTLGVDAATGRTFDPTFRRGGERVAVLSHGLWERAFGGDPGVVGRSVRIDEVEARVVGVLPAGFRFAPEPAEIWMRSPDEAPEIRGADVDIASMRDAWYFRVVGRLAEGVTLESATEEMRALAAALATEHPETNGESSVTIAPLRDLVVSAQGPAVRLLLGAALLVLLVAAANVTQVLLARSAATAGDRTTRRALGARSGRLAASAFLEGVVLAVGGGVIGVALALWLPDLALRVLPGGDVASEVGVPASGLGFALAAVAVTALLVSAVPALLALRSGPSLRPGARSSSGGSRARLRWATVGVQAALALALVSGAGLLLRSLQTVAAVDPGFDAASVWTARLAVPDARLQSRAERIAGYEAIRERVAALPGVERAAIGSSLPTWLGPRAGLRVVDASSTDDPPDVAWQPVEPGYLETLGVSLVQGRLLDPSDRAGTLEVGVVNEALVRTVFAGEDPLGRRVSIGLDGHDRPITIVGVVGDLRNQGPATPGHPVLYRPLAQARPFGNGDVVVALRPTPGAAAPSLSALRSAVAEASPTAAPFSLVSGEELVALESGSLRRMLALLGAFSALGLALGAVGIYGVGSFVVRQRRAELGLRMALGARPGSVVALVLRQGLAATGLGLLAGLPLTWLVGRGLAGFLVGVEPLDPVTLLAVAALLAAGTVAALAPAAREAARTDPAKTLRSEG